MTFATLDFAALRAQTDLRRVIEDDLGPPGKGRRWPCPVHHGEGANFGITPDGKHWKCWTCGASGDVFDYLARRDGITAAEAARRLDPMAGLSRSSSRTSARPARCPGGTRRYDWTSAPAAAVPEAAAGPLTPCWADTAWQAAVDSVVSEAEKSLWGKKGRPALDWLRARGLHDTTISRFRLGFVPSDRRTEPLEVLGGKALLVRRGVTVPWLCPGSWYEDRLEGSGPRWVGCNIRRLAADVNAPLPNKPKYQALAGSTRGYAYPWPDGLAPGVPALVCEGEFDALIGWQEAGWVVNVLTAGGAGQRDWKTETGALLAAAPDWLLCFDSDPAGDRAAREFAALAPRKARRLVLPDGAKDLTELCVSGGPVLSWLAGEFTRLGRPWPPRTSPEGGIDPCEPPPCPAVPGDAAGRRGAVGVPPPDPGGAEILGRPP